MRTCVDFSTWFSGSDYHQAPNSRVREGCAYVGTNYGVGEKDGGGLPVCIVCGFICASFMQVILYRIALIVIVAAYSRLYVITWMKENVVDIFQIKSKLISEASSAFKIGWQVHFSAHPHQFCDGDPASA